MTNLQLLMESTKDLSAEDARALENHFLGALSVYCPADAWQKALELAQRSQQFKPSAVAAASPASGVIQGEGSADPLRAEVSPTAGAIEKLAPSDIQNVCDEDICDECDHLISRHGKDGCEVERGDGYRGSRTVLEALGPSACTAVTFEPAEIEGAA